MSVVTLKKTYNSLRYGRQVKTLKFEIIGIAPFVEKIVLISEKTN